MFVFLGPSHSGALHGMTGHLRARNMDQLPMDNPDPFVGYPGEFGSLKVFAGPSLTSENQHVGFMVRERSLLCIKSCKPPTKWNRILPIHSRLCHVSIVCEALEEFGMLGKGMPFKGVCRKPNENTHRIEPRNNSRTIQSLANEVCFYNGFN